MSTVYIDRLKAGDVIIADGGFTCMEEGAEKVVGIDVPAGEPYVECDCGRHYLYGQVDDEDTGIVIGFTTKETL